MSSSYINSFREHRLKQEIAIKPHFKFILKKAFPLICIILILSYCTFYYDIHGDELVYPYFMFCFVLIIFIKLFIFKTYIWLSRSCLLSFSEEGLYHGIYQCMISWEDIIYADLYHTTATSTEVFILISNKSFYEKNLKGIRLWHFNAIERHYRINNWGKFLRNSHSDEQIDKRMIKKNMNTYQKTMSLLNDDIDKAALRIQSYIRLNLSSEETVEIINTMKGRD